MCEIETEREIDGHIVSARWLLGPLWLLIVGTLVGSQVGSAVAQPTEASDVSSQLRGIASAGQLPELRWPNFSDYREHVQNFYQPSDYTPAWVRNGQPTPQALAIINLLKQADSQGLDPEDMMAPAGRTGWLACKALRHPARVRFLMLRSRFA
jgi:hypothetical protein